ncbi:site-2 protease family protein, partial [Jatrophihabitans endophyticus]|uniref:M50 family metallopeptidase n=1 Tax=Jatrophihabitans endophyticus TaxID=1206085 RepID=UPI001A04617F
QLARIRGVPVVVSPSWLIIGVLLTVIYGPLVHDLVPHVSTSVAYAAAFGFAVLFALCILAHELGHTLVSMALGYSVQRVVLFLLGGLSEIEGEPRRARDEVLISAAGPLVSVVLCGAFVGGYELSPHDSLVQVLTLLLAYSNGLLAVFNLLPGLPLDGGRLLRAGVWGFGAESTTGTLVAGWTGRVLAVALAASGLIVDRTSAGFTSGLLTLVLAAYLWTGASQAIKVAELTRELPGVHVAELLRPGMLVPSDLSVAEALDRLWRHRARGLVLTDSSDRPSAIVDEQRIGAVPMERRAWTPVHEVARPLEPGLIVPADIGAADLLDRMQATPAREYLAVAADGSPAGIIATVDFARRLQHHSKRRTA